MLTAIGAPAPFRVGADASWTLVDRPTVATTGGLGRPRPGDRRAERAGRWSGAHRCPRRALGALRASGVPVALQPWQLDGDLALARAIVRRVGDGVAVLDPPRDLADARDAFREAGVVVGLRFHALVAAAAAGVPFVAVDHELKLGALARRFEQPLVSASEPPERFARVVVDALLDATVPPASVVQRQIALAEESFRLLRLVLERRREPTARRARRAPARAAPWEVPDVTDVAVAAAARRARVTTRRRALAREQAIVTRPARRGRRQPPRPRWSPRGCSPRRASRTSPRSSSSTCC